MSLPVFRCFRRLTNRGVPIGYSKEMNFVGINIFFVVFFWILKDSQLNLSNGRCAVRV